MAIKGSDLGKEVLTACNRTVFDLSGSAASEIVLYHKNKEILIHKVWIKYIEATSADAGVVITIGDSADADEFFTATSEVSKTALDSVEYEVGSMVLSTVPRDTPIYIAHAGGKSGDGTAIVGFSYTYND